MSDDDTCKKCYASVTPEKSRAHARWHEDLEEQMKNIAADAIKKWDEQMARNLRARGIGGLGR